MEEKCQKEYYAELSILSIFQKLNLDSQVNVKSIIDQTTIPRETHNHKWVNLNSVDCEFRLYKMM